MSEQPHLLHTLTDDDWFLIVGGLRKLNNPRGAELADRLHNWRLEVAQARTRFWEAFRVRHK